MKPLSAFASDPEQFSFCDALQQVTYRLDDAEAMSVYRRRRFSLSLEELLYNIERVGADQTHSTVSDSSLMFRLSAQ
jgi:hypothetical protein